MNKVNKALIAVGASAVVFGCGVLYRKKEKRNEREKKIFLSSGTPTIDDIFVNVDIMMEHMPASMWYLVKGHIDDFRLGYEMYFASMDTKNNNKFYAISHEGDLGFEFTWNEEKGGFDYVMSPVLESW